ncbi:MAG: sigma-70 family RNA polymerase sigma factor [Holophagales bacterium]|nr:sigma-70 family RNA polymerase sigma factor [Holophagales bacterium]
MSLPQPVETPWSSKSDAEVVKHARTGDSSARDELARRHRDSAFFLALQLLGNRDDALDVAQDAMLRFFTHLHRFDASRPVRPWLFQIVRNRVLDLHRRRKVRKHDSIEAAAEDEERPSLQLVDARVDLERDARQTQLQKRIWEALSQLSHQQREILVLRDYQDLSYKEIADTLNIPIGTVMSRLHGARKSLRQVLEDDLQNLLC